MDYCGEIVRHYERVWLNRGTSRVWRLGPVHELPRDFCVLEFAPTRTRDMWTYATRCMSHPTEDDAIELHLFSRVQSELHVELLTVIAHYHRTHTLGLGDTVNFGRPWMNDSKCTYGLISLPYLDGLALEEFSLPELGRIVRCLWLIPITKSEVEYKITLGLEALEHRFDESHFDFLNPHRGCVIDH
jgi:hypothetical protein